MSNRHDLMYWAIYVQQKKTTMRSNFIKFARILKSFCSTFNFLKFENFKLESLVIRESFPRGEIVLKFCIYCPSYFENKSM